MATLYEISGDLKSLYSLMEGLVDENGEPREPTAEEFETMKGWFKESEEAFKKKFDNYCRFIKNLRLSAENAEAEKKNFKQEADRLTKRAKAFTNRAKCVTELLRWGMERLELKKYKTDFFSAGIQNVGGKTIDFESGADFSKLPEEFLMPREPNKKAILEKMALLRNGRGQKILPSSFLRAEIGFRLFMCINPMRLLFGKGSTL